MLGESAQLWRVYEQEKEYRVLVARDPDQDQLEIWRRGVVLEDGYRTQPAEVRVEAPYGKGTWMREVLKEGRKRQIRETGKQLGLPVVKIIRIRIGPLLLGNLKPGERCYLSEAEVAALEGQPSKTQVRPTKTGFKPRKPEPRPKKRGGPSRPGRRSMRGKRK